MKQAPSSTNAKWSGAWPGTARATSGPKRSPSASRTSAAKRAAATGGRPSRSRSAQHALDVVEVVVRHRDPARAAARLDLGGHRVEVLGRAPARGRSTHAGSRPTTQVFVPVSVYGPGLSARTQRDVQARERVAHRATSRYTGPPSDTA